MFKNHINLAGEHTEIVDVYTSSGSPLAKGKLKLEPNRSPSLTFEDFLNFNSNEKIDLRARSHGGDWFVLLDCVVLSLGSVLPSLVVKDDLHDGSFRKIKVVLRGVSKWFDNSQFTEAEDQYIKKYLSTNKFNVSVHDKNIGNISISSENWWQTGSSNENDFSLSQKTAICIEALESSFGVDDVRSYVYQVKNLFSILSGYSLALEYCFDCSSGSNKSIYFVNFQETGKNFEHQMDCLVGAGYLFSQDKWGTIFRSAFEEKSENFKNIWSRLPGLSGFSRYWEYELLACVALVDRYAAVSAGVEDCKLKDKPFKNLKRHLKKEVDVYVSQCLKLDNKNDSHELLDSFRQQVGFIRNTKYPTFQSCFDSVFGRMSDSFRRVLNLSEDDFSHLKSLRNKIAHGDIPNTKNETDLTYEHVLKNKLLVLLYCWALREFGIPEDDYIRFLNNWSHPMVRSAMLNRVELDKAVGSYLFINLNKRDFNVAKNEKLGPLVLERIGNRKNYKLREDLTGVVVAWYRCPTDGKARNVEEHIASHVDEKLIRSVCYVSSAYICNNDNLHKTSGVCILNPLTDLVKNRRLWEYADKEQKWIQLGV